MITKYLQRNHLRTFIKQTTNTPLKPITTNTIYSNQIKPIGGYCFSFFKKNWRNNDEVITQNIKRCSTSDEISKIIQIHGDRLNLVHLTAILDRIQQQNMLKTSKIIEFTIQKLKTHQYYFSLIDPTNIRTISNIICYLGNLKNHSLNYIFINTNYQYLKQHTNTVQTSMLITGLIRLNIFKDIIGLKHQKSKKPILLEDILNNAYTRNQLLSIWFAYINEVSKQNVVFNNFLNKLIGEIQQKDQISLRTYTYAIVCYLKTCKTLQKPHQSPIFKLIKTQIPTKQSKSLHPYQFSLLLNHIKIIRRPSKTTFDEKYQKQHKDIIFPYSFVQLLHEQYDKICKKKNVTLRNIANIFKQFSESFQMKSHFLKLSINKSTSIIKQEINYCKKAQNYELDYKIDLLSFANLFWKLIENLKHYPFLYKDPSQNVIVHNYINSCFNYVKFLKDKQSLSKFSNKQLLMFMSGFFHLKPKLKYQLDEQIRNSIVSIVMETERKYTVKELTLFYMYLLAIKVESKDYCLYVRYNLQKMANTQQFANIPKAKEILNKECTLSLGQKCKKCHQPIPQTAQALPQKQ